MSDDEKLEEKIQYWRKKCGNINSINEFMSDHQRFNDVKHVFGLCLNYMDNDEIRLDRLQCLILMYRIIRNLCSVKNICVEIMKNSNMISSIFGTITNMFTILKDGNGKYCKIYCDVIRSCMQALCNLCNQDINDEVIPMNCNIWIWNQMEKYLVNWTNGLRMIKWKDENIGDLARVLEPMFYLIKWCILNDDNGNRADLTNKCLSVMFKMDDMYFKINDDESCHKKILNEIIPYFLEQNGLELYLKDKTCYNDGYFYYLLNVLFDITDQCLIDIKNMGNNDNNNDNNSEHGSKINLIKNTMKPTFLSFNKILIYFANNIDKYYNNKTNNKIIFNIEIILEILSNVSLISTSFKDNNNIFRNEFIDLYGNTMFALIKILNYKSENYINTPNNTNNNNSTTNDNTSDSDTDNDNDTKNDDNNDKSNNITRILSFRRSLICTIINLINKNKYGQDYIRINNYIDIILNMTKIDKNTIFLQQWCIFLIANLTKNNLENQKYIGSLNIKKSIQNDELKQMGFEVEYNQINGTIKLNKKSQNKTQLKP